MLKRISKVVGYDDVDWIQFVRDWVQWRGCYEHGINHRGVEFLSQVSDYWLLGMNDLFLIFNCRVL
jgi:hypothetical protein